MGDLSDRPILSYVWKELTRWRDEALAGGDRELASRLQRVISRLSRRDKIWRGVRRKHEK